MKLTPKQEKFAQNIASGMTQADAYRNSYSAEKMSENAIYREASLLMANGKVRARAEELKQIKTDRWAKSYSIPLDVDTYETIVKMFNDEKDMRKWAGYVLSKAAVEAGMLTSELVRPAISRGGRYAALERAGFKCQACGAKPRPDNDVILEIDHIIPFSLGGTNAQENLQVLCESCNASKSNKFAVNHNE